MKLFSSFEGSPSPRLLPQERGYLSNRSQLGVPSVSSHRLESAFTMVEIAISLGVIAFALVAIIGVLPMGLNVQRENREDTIINQDGPYFLEAISSGAKGLDHLTNYVDLIDAVCLRSNGTTINVPLYRPTDPDASGAKIIASLTKKKGTPIGSDFVLRVDAHVRALSGNAVEQGQLYKDMAFNYLLQTEVVPFTALTPAPLNMNAQDVTNNLFDLRITCRWPLLPNGNPGPRRKVFRTLASGTIDNATGIFKPQSYQEVQP